MNKAQNFSVKVKWSTDWLIVETQWRSLKDFHIWWLNWQCSICRRLTSVIVCFMLCFRYLFFYFLCVQLAQSVLDCGSHMLGWSFKYTCRGKAMFQRTERADLQLLLFFTSSRIFKSWIQLCQYLYMYGKTTLKSVTFVNYP